MRVRTDDEVYRVDAVWLGPPKATFPFRARYVAWAVGVVTFLLILTIERRLGFGFGFFTTGWALVGTILITRFITARITHERPLGAVAKMALAELRTPRQATKSAGGTLRLAGLKVSAQLPQSRKSPRRSRTSAHGGAVPVGDSPGPGTQPKDSQHHGF